MSILRDQVLRFNAGNDLSGGVAEAFLDALITESDEGLIEEVFRTWDAKGIAAGEIYEMANIMRRRCTRVSTRHKTFVDVVGTGGSRSKTFNVSTAAAFVVAGAGLPVAKHGNRAATSSSGSADLLSALGVEPAVDTSTAERCLDEAGMCFMFAPNFHRLSPTLGKVRRGLGFPTIFNCVGPLCNPAGAPHQLIGVWSEDLVPKMATALSRLGTIRSWIVHAEDGLDEVSLTGSTLVAEVENDQVRTFTISAGDFDVAPQATDGLHVSSPEESAALVLGILSGDMRGTAAESLVLLNAASALRIAGLTDSLPGAYRLARAALYDGQAKAKLYALAAAVNR